MRGFDGYAPRGMCMKRVLVVGAGIHGLVTAAREHIAKNQVFIVEKRKRIGGRGTSEESFGHQLEHGPHLLLKGGELHKMVKKLSKVKPSLRPLRPNKILVVGHGILYPVNNPKEMLNLKMGRDQVRENALRLISGWGQDIPERRKALLKGRLCVVGEGWAGLIGRLASTLEEVGVPIQTGMKITESYEGGVVTSKGLKIEADEVRMCDGAPVGDAIKVATLDVVLDNRPLKGLHGLVKGDVAILDLAAIHSKKAPGMSHFSCIALSGGVDAIEELLDERVSGWRSHIITKRENKSITLTDSRGHLSDGVI
ncbi:MAG: hypothetical protein CMA39_02970 [Euryarchaeota archaeon]|nr:hypothetical protein [Euryarchaeota archaeon]RAH13063.1 MAG: hypothetical protein CMB05_002635 [Euryarchaeota archaeon]